MSPRAIGEITITELPDGAVLLERVRNGLAIPAEHRAAVAALLAPEPSDAEIEALTSVAAAAQLVVERRESDQEFWGSSEPALNDEECNLKAALSALAAARAARRTGGERE